MNDGDRTYPFRAQALEIHTAFFGSKSLPPIVRPGPGAASLVRGFGQTFIFLDDRSFRSKNLTPEICRKLPSHSACKGKEFVIDREETHFGDEQERWLFTQLRASKGPIWLASGDQWFGAYHPFESFAGNHPKAFESFLRRLRPLGKKVLFLSGDRHLSEISRIEPSVLGYETFELTSSPIHARTFPSSWKEIPNPLQVNGIAENFNFLIVDSEAKEQELEARVKAIGLGGKVFFERQINLKK
jgi:alkaline phosphatase D